MIHQTYRVQYIRDVILPPDSTFEQKQMLSLKTFVSSNKIMIIEMVQDDHEFLEQMISELKARTSKERTRYLA